MTHGPHPQAVRDAGGLHAFGRPFDVTSAISMDYYDCVNLRSGLRRLKVSCDAFQRVSNLASSPVSPVKSSHVTFLTAEWKRIFKLYSYPDQDGRYSKMKTRVIALFNGRVSEDVGRDAR